MNVSAQPGGSNAVGGPAATAKDSKTIDLQEPVVGGHNYISETELTECDREQLQLIGGIQAHCGHVLMITFPAGTIVAADANARQLVWLHNRGESSSSPSNVATAESPVGGQLAAWIPFDLYEEIHSNVQDMRKSYSQRAFIFYKHQQQNYALSISTTTHDYSLMGLEIELLDDADTADSFFNTVTNLGRVMEFYAHETIVKAACDAVYQLLGHYDRGMVYRFNDDLSGEIIHEIKRGSVSTSYMGMRFPSSDIPLSARQLYIKNGLRYIHSVDYDMVPLLSNTMTAEEMDLTQTRMRAVAKPHVIYLRNMGVVCSLSLAIVVDNELWGLLAFHGYRNGYKPSLHQRIACETIAAMVSVRIEALTKKDQSARILRLGNAMMNLKQENSVMHNLYDWGEEILSILDCDVLVGHVLDPRDEEGDYVVIGDRSLMPREDFYQAMSTVPNRELVVLSTRKELESRGLTAEMCRSCGVAMFREGRTYIVLGRKERSKDVIWGGNPDEPKLRIGGILNPRASFDKFMEKAHKESRTWSRQDINVISVLRDRICEHSHNWMMALLQSDIESTNRKYMNAIDRARDNYEFFAHMSHELRTPFHGVMGCLSILHDSVDHMSRDEIVDLLKTAISSGNHMLNLLNDILDISKNKHLSHECTRNTVIFQNLAFEAIDGMKSLAQSRNVTLSCSISPNDGKDVIVTDRTKIIQIVSNTVNNAVKFTGSGGIDVRFDLLDTVQEAVKICTDETMKHAGMVFTRKDGEMLLDAHTITKQMATYQNSPDRRWLYFAAADRGCGMKPNELADMFSPYTQASGGSNRTFQGTGLGLYICLSLCQQLSGWIACGSTAGVGTTFHVGIPVDFCEHGFGESSHEGSPGAPEASKIIMFGPVMIVDDNKVNVKILKRALEMQFKMSKVDFLIITASGGQEAIDLFKSERPSLCIIDYHMPEVDGIATITAIRAFEQEKGLTASYIVCYTADATEKASMSILGSGADEIMSKPPPKGFIEGMVGRLYCAPDGKRAPDENDPAV